MKPRHRRAPIKSQESGTADPPATPPLTASPFLSCLFGRGLAWWIIVAVLAAFALQTEIQFRRVNAKPVKNGEFFKAERGYQNIDVSDWVMTGYLLPKSAIWVRAPRPLYPFAVTLAYRAGFLKPKKHLSQQDANDDMIMQGVRVLQRANKLFVILSLWMFFAAVRRFGADPFSAYLASALAGSGFGFSFWVTQAVPEVFCYFAVALTLAAILAAHELDTANPNQSAVRSAWKWGFVGLLLGILFLGKEIYSFALFGAILLAARRQWVAFAFFCIACALPTLGWNFYSVKIAKMWDPERYYREYQYVTWIADKILPATIPGKIGLIGDNFNKQVNHLFQAFAYVPVFFMIAGMIRRPVPIRGSVWFVFFLTFYLMMFASNFSYPRISFMMWPIVFLFAWRGIEWAGEGIAKLLLQTPLGLKNETAIVRTFQVVTTLFLIWLQTRNLFEAYFYG